MAEAPYLHLRTTVPVPAVAATGGGFGGGARTTSSVVAGLEPCEFDATSSKGSEAPLAGRSTLVEVSVLPSDLCTSVTVVRETPFCVVVVMSSYVRV